MTCAQDAFWEPSGAWTGELSPQMLHDAGATWIIVGHSERRQHFGDTNETVGKKASAVLGCGLGAIVCVGETLAERDGGRTLAVVDAQLDGALAEIKTCDSARDRVRAGVGDRHRPHRDAGAGPGSSRPHPQAARRAVRRRARGRDPDPVRRLGQTEQCRRADGQADIDGALVGGASLEAGDFVAIVKAARPS